MGNKVKPLREKNHFENVRELIEYVDREFKERVAFRYRKKPHDKEAVCVTYEQFTADVRALATEMVAEGYCGKHCAVIGKHSYGWIRIYFALLSIGAVIVPLDRDWAKEDLADTVSKAEAFCILADKDIAEKTAYIAEACGIEKTVFIDGEGDGSIDGMAEAGAKKMAEGDRGYYDAVIDPDKLATLVFTSGTTGKGKGVMLSQTNFISDLCDVIPFMDFSVRCMNVLPPHHTYGSSVTMFGQVSIGCDIYISSGVKYILKELKEHQPGHLVAVPLYVETFYRRILKGIEEKGAFAAGFVKTLIKINRAAHKIGLKPFDGFFRKKILANFGGKLNMIISGGAPLNQEMADLFDAIGVKVLNGYGITECAPIIAVNHNAYIIPKAVGIVLPIETVRINEPNEDGEGEIFVKGPNVMLGYYKDEEANKEAFSEDGFFKTGDYGKLEYDKWGNPILFITGRLKNLIILSNGKNVYPEEIEDALAATPGVLEIIVYEGKSKRGGEYNAIVAEIYPDKDYLDANGIDDKQEYFQRYVTAYNKTAVPYKKIGLLKVRDEEFPKNTLRKILRRKIDMTID